MTIEEILDEAIGDEVYLFVEGGKLKYKSKKGRLTPDLKEKIKSNKDGITAYLVETDGNKVSEKVTAVNRTKLSECLASYSQKRLWFFNHYIGPNPVYNLSLTLKFSGGADLVALKSTIREIFLRHEALRTRLEAWEDDVVQSIDSSEVEIYEGSVSSLNDLKDIFTQERNLGFDLKSDKLYRIRLIENCINPENKSYILLFVFHHSIMDGWSIGIVSSDIATIYDAYKSGRVNPLKPLDIQYTDYAYWQRQQLQGKKLTRLLSYWTDKLQDVKILNLPTDSPRPEIPTYEGRSLNLKLGISLTKKIKQFCDTHNVTLFMLLISAFSILISRYSKQNDIAIGTPIANRTRKEVENIVGFFTNTLVIRCDLKGNIPFLSYLEKIKRVTLDAYAHQDIPFEKLVDEINPHRTTRNPLFQVMFALQNAQTATTKEYHSDISSMDNFDFDEELSGNYSHFDMTFNFFEGAEQISGVIDYMQDLFDKSTIKGMARCFEKIIEVIVFSPHTCIHDMDIVTSKDNANVLRSGHAKPPSNTSIAEVFERKVLLSPDATAIDFQDSTNRTYISLSYQEVNIRANQIANYLRRETNVLGGKVGVFLDDFDARIPIVGIAILKAGAVYVDIDPALPIPRIAFLISKLGINTIVTTKTKHDLVCSDLRLEFQIENARNQEDIRFIFIDKEDMSNQGSENLKLPTIGAQPAAVEYIWHDSLTPSQHVLTHGNLLSFRMIQEKYLICPNHFYNTSKARARRSHIYGFIDCLLRDDTANIDKIKLAPKEIDISSGNTELHEDKFYLENTEYFCVLSEDGHIIPEKVIGRLYVSSDAVTQGFAESAARTASEYIPSSIAGSRGERLYRTSIEARYISKERVECFKPRLPTFEEATDLSLEYSKGLISQIKRLILENAQLVGAEVRIVKDRDNKKLVCYLIAKSQILEDEQDSIRSDLINKIKKGIDRPRIPDFFFFVKEIPDQYDTETIKKLLQFETLYEPPTTTVEKDLCDIWSEVLGCEKVSVNDNFFDLGGSSLLVVRMISRMESRGYFLLASEIFNNPTVSELAKVIGNTATIEQNNEEREIPTNHIYSLPNKQLLFRGGFNSHWLDRGYFSIKDIDIEKLEKAIKQLFKEHDNLSSYFIYDENKTVHEMKHNLNNIKYLDVEDLSELENRESKIAYTRNYTRNTYNDIDIEKCLFRFVIFHLGDGESVLLWVFHHSLVDFFCQEIILRDLLHNYLSLVKDNKLPDIQQSVSLNEWGYRLHQYINCNDRDTDYEYWMSRQWNEVKLLMNHQERKDFVEDNDPKIHRDPIILEGWLGEEATKVLLQEQSLPGDISAPDIVLSSFVEATSHVLKSRFVRFDLTHHGRSNIIRGLDLSRTAGWLIDHVPVIIESGESIDELHALRSFITQFRAIPSSGLSFSGIKFLHKDEEKRKSLSELGFSEFCINFIPASMETYQYNSNKNLPWDLIAPTGEDIEPPKNKRNLSDIDDSKILRDMIHWSFYIEIYYDPKGEYVIKWMYSSKAYDNDNIKQVNDRWVKNIKSLVSASKKLKN